MILKMALEIFMNICVLFYLPVFKENKIYKSHCHTP